VLSVYTKIISSDPWSYTYYCACDRDYVCMSAFAEINGFFVSLIVTAFVYPDEFRHMYLCKQFWGLAKDGTDSKGGGKWHF
jgi:hypothetical protein